MTLAIVWFRRDFRLHDNAALHQASAEHGEVLPLYIHAPEEDGAWKPGAASRWWLHHSLTALNASLAQHRGGLHISEGESLKILLDVIERSGARAVYFNRLYEPEALARDKEVEAALAKRGIAVRVFAGALWHEPEQISTLQGDPFRVFTPFWRRLRPRLEASEPLSVPSPLRLAKLPRSLPLNKLALLPRLDWDSGFRENWTPGEQGAQDMLELFADDAIADYSRGRDIPARHGTSRMSPHLHFGEITPRQIHYALEQHFRRRDAKHRPDLEPYLRELGWREFSHHLLYHFPKTPTENFNPRFASFKWAHTSPAVLQRWQQGRTGIPLIDAGMRELWHTGWMHNRVRMVVASFLTKNLRQHWHHGAEWFWDTLVDADLANNTLGWQWVAGCGADAAPYFRVFNPVTQARKFDPDGQYLLRWLPELRDAGANLFEPWKDASLLKRSGYPAPIVDIGQSRLDALAAYQASRR